MRKEKSEAKRCEAKRCEAKRCEAKRCEAKSTEAEKSEIYMSFSDISVMRQIPQELPTPGTLKNYTNPNNKYRPVITSFGLFNAMYLMDENGVPGWYTSYAEKLIIPVKSWIEIFDKK